MTTKNKLKQCTVNAFRVCYVWQAEHYAFGRQTNLRCGLLVRCAPELPKRRVDSLVRDKRAGFDT